jgi:hypothetical protein
MQHQQRQHPSQHPLRGTVIFNPGDTSADTSYTNIQDEADLSEPREVKIIFGAIGRETQGPAGVPIPEENDESEYMEFEDIVNDVEYRYSDDPEAPGDAIGEFSCDRVAETRKLENAEGSERSFLFLPMKFINLCCISLLLQSKCRSCASNGAYWLL